MVIRGYTFILFPYTTLFRSQTFLEEDDVLHEDAAVAGLAVPFAAEVIASDQCLHDVVLEMAGEAVSEAVHALRSEEHTSELQSPCNIVCRLLLEEENEEQDG